MERRQRCGTGFSYGISYVCLGKHMREEFQWPEICCKSIEARTRKERTLRKRSVFVFWYVGLDTATGNQ